LKGRAIKEEEGRERRPSGHLGSEWAAEDLSRHEAKFDESVGLFFGFSTLAATVISCGLYLVLYLVSPRLGQFHMEAPRLALYLISGLVAVFMLALFLVFLTVRTGKGFFPAFLSRGGRDKGLIMLVTPLAVKVGGLFGVTRDRVASSFIKVNNALVIAAQRSKGAGSLLILLPRCIQHSRCRQQVEIDINNCKDCGLCDINEIIRICEENGVESFVATGGNLARKLIMEKRPSAVIGVACERELLSGIHDTSGLPVIGIPNIRPEGPCIDTRVDLEKLETAVKSFRSGSLST